MSTLRVALLAIDAREAHGKYDRAEPYFGQAPAALIEGFKGLPGVELHIVSCTRRAMTAPPKLAENIWFHSLPVRPWGFMRSLYFGCVRAVRGKLRELRPDIVHGQGSERDCAISAAFSGFPNLITLHGHMSAIARHLRARPLSFHWLAAYLEALAVRRAQGVLCLSSYGEAMVAGRARRTWRLPNAVAPDFFTVERRPSEPPLFLCVGSICREKGQTGLMRALDPVAARRPLRLAFFGEPIVSAEYGREFQRMVAERPWCEARGFAAPASLCASLAEATALVHPTLEDNCPMAVIEAMAAGLPVIASRVGGVPDLVTAGHTGWLCEPDVAASFADAVGELLSDPARATTMGEAARAEALRRFHPRAIAARHLEIYREVLAAGAA